MLVLVGHLTYHVNVWTENGFRTFGDDRPLRDVMSDYAPPLTLGGGTH